LPSIGSIQRFEPDDNRPELLCGDGDLDEFYLVDSIESAKQLLSVTYLVKLEDGTPCAFFSVFNDAVKKSQKEMPRSAFERLSRPLPREKRYASVPAVKIGRLGVANNYQGIGVGQQVVDFLKEWFTSGNKTGCRFLLVDAYNQPKVTRFYENNGFAFLTGSDEKEKTRIMYFDLSLYHN